MKILLVKSSNKDFKEKREINSIEDLKNLQKEFGDALIIDFESVDENNNPCVKIEIYDDWREKSL